MTASLRFVDLFAGLGGFHLALSRLGHRCVFAAEIDDELRQAYVKNFPDMAGAVVGDITANRDKVPPHDILCAGFPCQPFSKSGYQQGMDDTRGTAFDDVLHVARRHKPGYIIIENVGNLEQHDGGNTWRVLQTSLRSLGYQVAATLHVKSGGTGLLSPHHFGYPQTRERFYAVASRHQLPDRPLPLPQRGRVTSLSSMLQTAQDLSELERLETRITASQRQVIDHWNCFVKALPPSVEPPSFPLWTDEFSAEYPYANLTPHATPARQLLPLMRNFGARAGMSKQALLELLPSYAVERRRRFPDWKIRFIEQNRGWYEVNRDHISKEWLDQTRSLVPSHRKFEWNCKGETRDLWRHVLQFRPSGLRVKRSTSIPALVSLTTTQIPVIGPKGRFLSRTEGLRLQGFPDDHRLPDSLESAFRALGNAVHVGVATQVAAHLLNQSVDVDVCRPWSVAGRIVTKLPAAAALG